MLVDSHCHLDFPDFAEELDQVVARAAAADVGTLVTISTRVRKFDQVRAVAERFDNVYCSVGTHPHNAHEELDVTADDLARIAAHPKVVAIGEAGLDYHYDNSPRDAQAAGFRTHIAAARATGLPLVIHAREADADLAAILKEETEKGAFPAVLHCFSSGRQLAETGIALGHYVSFSGILTFKNAEDIRTIARDMPAERILVETDAPYLAPVPHRGTRNEPAYRRRYRRGACRHARRRARRDRGADDGEFFSALRQGPETLRAGLDSLRFTILGCGSSPGVPRIGRHWGDCDPTKPKNRRRRCSILVQRVSAAGVTNVLVDTSPDLREQALAPASAPHGVIYTHSHADHIHGIDDLRGFVINMRRRVDIYADAADMARLKQGFGYCFETPPGSEYPPILNAHRSAQRAKLWIAGTPGDRSRPCRSAQMHGNIGVAWRSASAGWHIRPTSAASTTIAVARLQGLDVWIVDALRRRPHPSHFSLDEALGWIERIEPRRAILTHMHVDLDYATFAVSCRRMWSRPMTAWRSSCRHGHRMRRVRPRRRRRSSRWLHIANYGSIIYLMRLAFAESAISYGFSGPARPSHLSRVTAFAPALTPPRANASCERGRIEPKSALDATA